MSITVSDVRAEVSIDTDSLRRGEREVEASTGRISDMFHSLASGAAAVAVGTLVANAVGQAVGWARDALSGLVGDMVDTNAQFEMYTAQFDVLLGGHERAVQRMKELEQFAVATPFNLDEIIRADQTLQNFGLHSEGAAQAFGKSGKEIRTIAGDVAAGTRASFDEVSLLLGRFASGDTGRAIMRMQELGITTREEMRRMGIQFSQSGQLLSPLPEAMSAVLTLMEEKYGGLMEVESKTLLGMRSNFEDWKTNMKRQMGEPIFDALKDQYQGLLDLLGSEAATEAATVLTDAIRWAVEGAMGLLGDLGSFVAPYVQQAFQWGANIVEQFAAGITGSGALADALRGLGDQVMYWLMPGSPPRIVPNLDRWGMGAAEAYFQGWANYAPEIGPWLRDMYKSLQPHLEEISASGMFGADQRGRLREAFGDQSHYVEEVAASYADLVSAARRAAEAQEALDEARGTGDEEAIASAQERLDLAADEETQARRNYAEAQGRMTAKMRQEAELKGLLDEAARATIARARAESDAAAKAAQREAEAEAKRQAAEAKRLHDAKLAYEMATTDTAGQIAILRRELGGVEEESVEYYQILTRIAGLEKQLASQRAGAGGGAGWSSVADGMSDATGELADGLDEGREKIDWSGIGRKIGESIVGGVVDFFKSIPQRMVDASEQFRLWAESPETAAQFMGYGETLAGWAIDGIKGLFKISDKEVGESIVDMFVQTVLNLQEGAMHIGAAIAAGVVKGIVAEFTSEERAGEIAESIRQAMVNAFSIWFRTTPGAGTMLGILGFARDLPGLIEENYGEQIRESTIGQRVGDVANDLLDRLGLGTTPSPNVSSNDTYNDVEINIDARGADPDAVSGALVDGLRRSGVTP